MLRLLPCVLVLCLTPSAAFSQDIGVSVGAGELQPNGQAPRDSRLAGGRSAIQGRVLATGGQPMRRATVRISALELRGARTTVTDADGRFEFKALPAGRYSIAASKSAFVDWAYGQTQPGSPGKPVALADNQTAENIDIRLPRGAVITGRVTDEFGEPVANASVTPLRSQYTQGQRRFFPVSGRAQTNDNGDYRIFGLPPGQYYLSSSVQALTLATPNGNSVDVSGQSSGYAPTFYPSSADIALAQKLTVGVAQTLSGIDIELQPTRLATLTGSAIDVQGRPMTAGGVVATPRRDSLVAGGPGGPLRPDGTFVIPNVPPGEYVLRATVPRPAGTVTNAPADISVANVSVDGDDVPGIRLTPVPLVSVSGHVSFDDAGGAPSIKPSAMRVVAQALNTDDFAAVGFGAAGPLQSLRDDFTFELKTAPGRIALVPTLQTGGASTWHLKAIRANGADVTDNGIEVGNQSITGVEIEMTGREQQLSGMVTDAAGQVVKDCAVAVFAQDRARWKAATNRYAALGRPGDDGGFKIGTLPPGEYYAIALDHLDSSDWQAPETLDVLSRQATPFALAPGDSRRLTLRLFTYP